MSREQGPRAQRGDATVVNVAGRRQEGVLILSDLTEATHMSREQGPRAAWGCEREQGARAPRSGDATVRESLAATGKEVACGEYFSMVRHNSAPWHAGGDRRIGAGHRQRAL